MKDKMMQRFPGCCFISEDNSATSLTQCFVVFHLLSPATKQCSGSFLEEALCRTRDVEIWCRMTAACRQTLRTEALWTIKACQCAAAGGVAKQTISTKTDRQRKDSQRGWQRFLTCVKKSCLRMWSRLGRSSGVLASRLVISCLACAEREEGRE